MLGRQFYEPLLIIPRPFCLVLVTLTLALSLQDELVPLIEDFAKLAWIYSIAREVPTSASMGADLQCCSTGGLFCQLRYSDVMLLVIPPLALRWTSKELALVHKAAILDAESPGC
jgi:hypothetical protein